MRTLKSLLYVVSTAVLSLLSHSLIAAESITIPRISAEPTLADFAGMEPNSALALSMSKVEGLIQREPDDGEPASQHTEVYLGYDQEQVYAIFLAFDTQPNLIRANLSSREKIWTNPSLGTVFQ